MINMQANSQPNFIGIFIIQLLIFYAVSNIMVRVEEFSLAGFLITLFIWAPVNAFSEQLIWIYVYDAFANRFEGKALKIVFSGIGILFFWALIGLIHVLFWVKFLMEMHPEAPYWQIFMGLQYPLTIGYLMIYRKTKSMVPIFLFHLFQDMTGVLLSGYSIVPYLFK